MPYVVVVNLSYDHHTQDQCSEIWELISNAMLGAGFQRDDRLFTVNLPEKDATMLARSTIERVSNELRSHNNENIYDYLQRFYGYDVAHTTNLLLPPADSIEVEERT
jgi:hypothetical protein